MEFKTRNEIDSKKWDQRIENDAVDNIFCYSWYLDAVAEEWAALITDDYQTILPIPFTKKLGVIQIYQPPFTRELDIFGDDFKWSDALSYLERHFKAIQFRNRESNLLKAAPTKRAHQFILLNDAHLKYSTNAKRLIKKGQKLFEVRMGDKPIDLIELFKKTTLNKVQSMSEKDLNKLRVLMTNALKIGKGDIFEIREHNQLIAGAFFLKDKKRITYLKGASTEESKKNGAFYTIMDYAIQGHKNEFETFDFGGSDIESVAKFNKKFGAEDRTYYNYNINNLPGWFKALKRLKG